MIDDIQRILVRELETVIREIEAFPDDELLWECPAGISNSAGNLALHLAGNLRHFIGATLGDTGYVRDRAREFGARDLSRTEVAAEVQAAIDDLQRVFPRLEPADLRAPYRHQFAGLELPTGRFLLHLGAHAAMHMGQIGYLRRILTGDNTSVGVTPIAALAD